MSPKGTFYSLKFDDRGSLAGIQLKAVPNVQLLQSQARGPL